MVVIRCIFREYTAFIGLVQFLVEVGPIIWNLAVMICIRLVLMIELGVVQCGVWRGRLFIIQKITLGGMELNVGVGAGVEVFHPLC